MHEGWNGRRQKQEHKIHGDDRLSKQRDKVRDGGWLKANGRR